MRVGVVSWLYPSRRNPNNGNFVKEELDRLAPFAEIRLIAPLHHLFWFGEPHSEMAEAGYQVIRPLTMLFPSGVFQKYSVPCMAATLKRSGGFFDGCDLVHAHLAYPDGVAAVRAFGGKFPLMVTVHGGDINLSMSRPSLRPLVVDALNSTRLVVCVSRSLETTLRERGVTAATEIIPNGIDTALFAPGEKRTACEALGLDPDRPRILFAGNFLPWKGVEYLIRAFPDVARAVPGCELVLLGARSVKDYERYKGDIEAAGVGPAVKICPWIPNRDLPLWFCAADGFCLPSLMEGFGIVAAEALACGRPVAATRSGGPEDIVREGLGMLAPPGDSPALADALIRVLRGEGILDTDSIARSARERFSHEKVTRRILDAYARVR
jgi:teichuronic acid biosynthesis glycosyltransferase TuaC